MSKTASWITASLIPIFKALCDPNRLCILSWLARRETPQSVKAVASCCQVDLSVISRHLALMRNAGLLKAEKRGKEVCYSVNANLLPEILRSLADGIESCCPMKAKTIKKKEKHHGDKRTK